MDNTLRFILSLSILIAVVIGIVRYRKIDPSYYPFLYYTWLALFIELAAHTLMQNGLSKAMIIMLNIYTLGEFGLFAWLFHRWRLFNRNKTFFIAMLGGFFIAWVILTLIISRITQSNYYFRILYSFALIFFSVSTFNKMVVTHRGSIFRNAQFWICMGVIIFFTFFILDCTTKISLFRNKGSNDFRSNLQEIMVFSNLLVNLLFAVAVIWIPRKKNFTTRF
jgi:hypothetical protein